MTDSTAIDVLHRDARICVLNKPPGIMVHRSRISEDSTFLDELLREQLGCRVFPVHRLDRATSGVLLFALDRDAAARLGRQFEAATVAKTYLAVVRGWLDDAGAVDRSLKRGRGTLQTARTRYRCLARTELPIPVPPHETARYSLAEIVPETGRTHQIRRHFNHIAHPVVGDVNHGDRRHNRLFKAEFGCHRLLLHARRLSFRHPEDDAPTTIEAPLSDDFERTLAAIGLDEPMRVERADPAG